MYNTNYYHSRLSFRDLINTLTKFDNNRLNIFSIVQDVKDNEYSYENFKSDIKSYKNIIIPSVSMSENMIYKEYLKYIN